MSAYLNDVWRFNMSSIAWSWIAGSLTTATASYGTPGVASTNNYPAGTFYPGAKFAYGTENLFVFGGQIGRAYINELWMFNVSSLQCTFYLKGTDAENYTDSYAVPGQRYVLSFTALPQIGLFLMVNLFSNLD